MRLQEQLVKLNKQELITKAKELNLYFNNDFSKTWIIKKIKEKLLAEKYLKKLTSDQLTTQSISTIKQIIKKDKINTKKIKSITLKELKTKLFVQQKNKELTLANELQEKLAKILLINTHVAKTNSKKQLPFFFYVLLELGEIKKMQSTDNINYKKQLYSFLSEINNSSFENDKFYKILISYSKKAKIISENKFKLTNNFKYWLKESYHQKILELIKIFFPNYNKILRQIIAVLSKYPKNKTISKSFLTNELNIQPFSQENKKLLSFFDILSFNQEKLQLTDFCWNVFTKNYQFIQPTISKNNIIVNSNTNLSLLWFIITNTDLIKINDKLIFEIKHKNKFLKDYNSLLAK